MATSAGFTSVGPAKLSRNLLNERPRGMIRAAFSRNSPMSMHKQALDAQAARQFVRAAGVT